MTTRTTNLGLPKPVFDTTTTWHELYYEAMELLDNVIYSLTGVSNIKGVWVNSTSMLVNERYLDDATGQLYQCAVAHTSAASPTTFLSDRTANPTYWELIDAGSIAAVALIQSQNLADLNDASIARTNLNVEDGADVTDTTNVTAAGALMDSELTNITAVKGLDQTKFGLLNVQTFTSSGTYTPTSGAVLAIVDIQAAGGGGANGNSAAGEVGAGSGGNAGNRVRFVVDVSGIGTASLTLGAVGGGGSTAGADGSDGSNSVWSDGTSTVTVKGGKGGVSNSANTTDNALNGPAQNANNAITSGANYIATLIDANGALADGTLCLGTATAIGSNGADSSMGTGGRSRPRNGNGSYTGDTALGYGAGGGGGTAKDTVVGGADGGDGSGAIITIEEYSN